jgi:hypothetical protein
VARISYADADATGPSGLVSRCEMPHVRSLVIAPSLLAKLARVWELGGMRAPLAIDEHALAEAERELGSVMPDEVLGLLAARGEVPARLVENTAERHLHASSTWSRSVARDPAAALVVIESFGDHPRYSFGYRPTPERTSPAIVVWDWKSWTRWADHPARTVELLVDEHLAGRGAAWTDGDPVALGATPSAAALAAFAPAIVRPEPTPDRFVIHTKFGRGRVLREVEGTLEIEFEAHGTRKLLARFVRDA